MSSKEKIEQNKRKRILFIILFGLVTILSLINLELTISNIIIILLSSTISISNIVLYKKDIKEEKKDNLEINVQSFKGKDNIKLIHDCEEKVMEKVHNKLVRDKIPEMIEKDNNIPVIHILSDSEYKKELENKLLEECKEVLESTSTQDRMNELGDVIEVISSLAKLEGKDLEEVIETSKVKKLKRGGFDKRIYLEKEIINDK